MMARRCCGVPQAASVTARSAWGQVLYAHISLFSRAIKLQHLSGNITSDCFALRGIRRPLLNCESLLLAAVLSQLTESLKAKTKLRFVFGHTVLHGL